MTQPREPLTAAWAESLSDVRREDWERFRPGTPFMRWDWLRLLEETGCVTPGTGWLPRHLLLHRGGELVGAAPMYVRTNSSGEFVFDQVWAEVAARIGLSYYPKLTAMSPFTPATGYEPLTAPEADTEDVFTRVLDEAEAFVRGHGLSGLNVNFASPRFAEAAERAGMVRWEHQGFVWSNPGYASLDEFLAYFRRSRRRNVTRERRALRERGVRVEMVEGADVSDAWVEWLYAIYERTNAKFGPWGCHYLNRDFFQGIFRELPENLVVAGATEGGRERPLAMALFAKQGERLWGRYWGCFEEVPGLHFEVCYYTPMEYCIEHGLREFDPGMGGAHKARRGFASRSAYSLHRFSDPRLHALLRRHMPEINSLERTHVAELNELLPFKEWTAGRS
ncbi:GNAT family N-acetyltransferase [Desulfohalovibrio reitneri]|uniref:GNAT family N-acetyltransferase n=1 Tax=Desulfohalovibrio reitneri TaxID=1307759 RepID=UPI0004A71250|nr:GNAT family N-acetyltransferase [Desulfohalovibrio reitneri]